MQLPQWQWFIKNKKVWEIPELLMMETKNTEAGNRSFRREGAPAFLGLIPIGHNSPSMLLRSLIKFKFLCN